MARDPDIQELRPLADGACGDTLSDEDVETLADLLRGDKQAQAFYLKYFRLHAELQFHFRGQQAHRAVLGAIQAQAPSSPPSSSSRFLPATFYGATAYLSSGWPAAYLIATVILGVGLFVGGLIRISSPAHSPQSIVTVPKAPPLFPIPDHLPQTTVVGRITGMVDCVWKSGQRSAISDQQLYSTSHYPPATNHSVALGDTLALRSGLLEITYNSGAKVILQGPVTYEVESACGGYLSIGKLTAKLEKKSEVRDQRSEDRSQRSEPASQESFAVRTPTAIVTDLGTEFGVEVDGQGLTTSHVFRGLVRIQRLGNDGKPQGSSQVLRQGESVQVDGSKVQIAVVPAVRPAVFVREMPKRKIRTFDLVDVVAGGDGFSGRRNAGIDPATGRATSTPPQIREAKYQGNNTYHRVESLPLVDGVFIPNGQFGNVQVDSAGHTFGDFPVTQNLTACYLWAGGAVPMDNPYPSLTMLDGVDYSQPERGLLFLHANKGITFDLEAIRKANPDWKPSRFCAVAGNSEKYSEAGAPVAADVWVLVDGQVRYRRRDINGCHGAFSIAIPIAAGERFLTLVATDGDGNIGNDWIIFGDPRLELTGVNTPVNRTK